MRKEQPFPDGVRYGNERKVDLLPTRADGRTRVSEPISSPSQRALIDKLAVSFLAAV